jgi:hypothetical protein
MSGVHLVGQGSLIPSQTPVGTTQQFPIHLTENDVSVFDIARRCFPSDGASSKPCEHVCTITLNDERSVQSHLKDHEIRQLSIDFSSDPSLSIQIYCEMRKTHFSSDFAEALLTDLFQQVVPPPPVRQPPRISERAHTQCVTKKAVNTFVIDSRCFESDHVSKKICEHDCTVTLKDKRSAHIRLRSDRICLLYRSFSESQIVCELDESHFKVSFTEALLTELFKDVIYPSLSQTPKVRFVDEQEKRTKFTVYPAKRSPKGGLIGRFTRSRPSSMFEVYDSPPH